MEVLNKNPQIYAAKQIERNAMEDETDENQIDEFDPLEIFDLIRSINDPEHPYTLEQLNILQHDFIKVDNENSHIFIQFTPTITNCSMATLIGLCIRVKLLRSLPKRFKIDINVTPGAHSSEEAVNKQLNDKERVAAALENSKLLGVVDKALR